VRIIEIEGDSHEVFGRNEAVFVGKIDSFLPVMVSYGKLK
jgi:hypothetical protein